MENHFISKPGPVTNTIKRGYTMFFKPGLYRATNAGVVKCRVDFAAADTYPPNIFLEALGGHLEDDRVIYTRLGDQDLGVFDEVLKRYGIGELNPAG
jgi:hypothetical protein